MKKVKMAIKNKDFIKKRYKEVFDIVKKHIDALDLVGLIEMGAPQDEYEFEIAVIVIEAIKPTTADELTDRIIKTFNEAVDENFDNRRKEIVETAKSILEDIDAVGFKLEPDWQWQPII